MKNRMPKISQFNKLDELNRKCAELLVAYALEAIDLRGGFSLVLSGGSTPESLYELLATPGISRQIDWGKVHFFWGDERCVPPEQQASNFKMADRALLSMIPVHKSQVHRMKGELEPKAGAVDYEKVIINSQLLWGHPSPKENMPIFDLVLLGLGNDGHTASLFPRTEVLTEKRLLVCAVPAPDAEPGVPRLTLTLPVLNNARHVWFITAGPKKREIMEAIVGQEESLEYPASQIKPYGNLHWFVTE